MNNIIYIANTSAIIYSYIILWNNKILKKNATFWRSYYLCKLCIGECPSNSPFLKNNGAEAPKDPRPIDFKEWRDTRTFSNVKSTHCTLLIWLIINLVTKKGLCIVSKVQSIKLLVPCGTLKVQRTITLHSLKIMESFDNRFTSQVDFNCY